MGSQSWETPGEYTWTVPDNVSEVQIRCSGGGGGGGAGSYYMGGRGGDAYEAQTSESVSPGSTLYIGVGGGGGGGTNNSDDPPGPGGSLGGGDGGDPNAGGGGGRSYVSHSSGDSNYIVIGGGGGGGGASSGGGGGGGDGGDAGYTGSDGNDGDDPDYDNYGTGGEGGSYGSGGSAGSGSGDNYSSTDGGSRSGGRGGSDSDSGGAGGGGGGAGYGGGGGGGGELNSGGGGGGGGSTHTGTTGASGGTGSSDYDASDGDDGYVIIEWTEEPATPDNATIDYVGVSQIDISWDADTSAGDIEQYRIQRSVDGSSYSTVTTTTSTTYTDTDINPDTDYRYRIRAENSAGESSYTYTNTRTSGGTPKSFTIAATANSSIDLSWTNPSGDWDTVEVYAAQSSGSAVSDYNQVGTTTSGSYNHTGLTNGRSYYYRLRAVYPDDNSNPTEEVVGTTNLPAPTLDSVTAGYRAVDLSWTLNDDNPNGEVGVDRGSSTVLTTGLSTTSHTDDGLLDGKQYSYTIVRDTGDATASSTTVSDITDLPPAENLSVESVNGRYATLSWTDPSNNASGYRLLLQRPADSSYSQDGSDISPVNEGETVTHQTTELLDGQQYDATVETFTADTTAREDQ